MLLGSVALDNYNVKFSGVKKFDMWQMRSARKNFHAVPKGRNLYSKDAQL